MPGSRGVVVVGGSFDHFHVGHRALLRAAFRAGASVGIGVTTARYLDEHPKPWADRIQPYRIRAAAVRRFVRREFPGRRWWLAPLNDRWGRSVEPDVGLLVATEETRAGGTSVNAERARRGLRPVHIRYVPLVRGEDGLAVSARRIRAGVIDRNGRRRRPLRVGVVSDDEAWLRSLSAALHAERGGLPIHLRADRVRAERRPDRVRARDYAREAMRTGELGVGLAHDRTRAQGRIAWSSAEGDGPARPWRPGAPVRPPWKRLLDSPARVQRKVISRSRASRR